MEQALQFYEDITLDIEDLVIKVSIFLEGKIGNPSAMKIELILLIIFKFETNSDGVEIWEFTDPQARRNHNGKALNFNSNLISH